MSVAWFSGFPLQILRKIKIAFFYDSFIKTKNTHGTGCTLSAALAVKLAEGETLTKAAAEAKEYLTGAIEAAKDETIGQGSGPVRHFWLCGIKGR